MTAWICPKCQASLAPWMPNCPCSPPATIVPATNTTPMFSRGCPQCGKLEQGVCSSANCPNYGTRCAS